MRGKTPRENISKALQDGEQIPTGPVAFVDPSFIIPDGTVTLNMLSTEVVSVIQSSTGDMAKAVYDTDNDGVVDAAESVPWTGITGKVVATTGADGLLSATDKTKLDGIATGANNYVHPANHPPSIITQDASNRFTSDAEKTAWNAKASTAQVTTSVDGLMIAADKTKLDGVATGANNYVHPASHPPSIITQDASNRFTTDAEKTTWNGKASTAQVTTSVDGLMIAADKTKLNGIATGAEVNQNTFATISVSGQTDVVADAKADVLTLVGGTGITITTNAATDAVTITATGSATPGAHATSHITGGTDIIPNAVASGNAGLLSGADKAKLDGVATGAEVNQNTFSTITVAGQSDVVADAKADTLTLVAGTNVTITTNAATDTVTIAATGGGTPEINDAAVSSTTTYSSQKLTSGTVITSLNADMVDGVHVAGLMQTSHAANSITGFGAVNPVVDGTANVGTATTVSRSDHVHPTDTSRAPTASPTFTGTATSPIFASTQATGTAPLTVASTTVVTNLNADMVDGVQGTDLLTTTHTYKDVVRAATVFNVTLSGLQTIDGVSLVAGDRVLVKNHATAALCGIYVVSSGAWTRATDADTAAKLTYFVVRVGGEGLANPNSFWSLTTAPPITLGTTSLTFAAVGGTASSTNPVMDGVAAVGSSTSYAKGDHVHPSDTSRAPTASPTFTGTVTLAADPASALQAATKQYVDTSDGDKTTLLTTAKTSLVAAVNELFQSVSNGKTSVAAAITGKGVATAGTDTFATMTTNINAIPLAALPGTNWVSRTSAADNNWNSVCFGNGLYVAVGWSGTGNRCMTSPDGTTWTTRTTPVDNNWQTVGYGNGLFVALATTGTGNRAMSSPDGITWTIRSIAVDVFWNSVCYANGMFVGVGNGNPISSPDGITWTARTAATSANWNSVCYANGLFVAVNGNSTGNRVMTSPDGITWTARVTPPDKTWISVCYGNGLFVAVANGGGAMYSPNGIIWTAGTIPTQTWNSVAFGNGIFVAVCDNATGTRVATSTDGNTWTFQTTPVNNNWNSVCYGNGQFVAVSWSGTGNRVMVSPGTSNVVTSYVVSEAIGLSKIAAFLSNSGTFAQLQEGFDVMVGAIRRLALKGIAWATRKPAVDNAWQAIAYGNGVFVAVSNTGTGNRVMSSPDGIVWTARTSAADNNWTNVCFGNGVFVAISNSTVTTSVMTSPDGVTWTLRTAPSTDNYLGICFGANGLFVATANTGTGNRVMTGPDGVNWTKRTSTSDAAWNSVAYGGGIYVAVSTSGTVMTSPDGVTWTARTASIANTWNSVCYGNGLFVAVASSGSGNRVMTSPDGITWTTRTSVSDFAWSSVCYGGGLFVTVALLATANAIMTSPDGITWTTRSAPVSLTWSGVCYGNNTFVAVATNGTANGVMTL